MELIDDELLHMLGYINPEQWADALSIEDLDKDSIWRWLNIISKMYPGIKQAVEEVQKKMIIERLTR